MAELFNILPNCLPSRKKEKSTKFQSAKTFSTILPNNCVRLIGLSLSSNLAIGSLGIDVTEERF